MRLSAIAKVVGSLSRACAITRDDWLQRGVHVAWENVHGILDMSAAPGIAEDFHERRAVLGVKRCVG
jgi:hypothetical protein